MAVRVFDGVDDVLVLDEGALDTILNGAFTIAALFKRSGSTSDGTQFLISLDAGVNASQRGCVSISSGSAIQLTVNGVTRTFGLTISDNVWYLVVVKKAAGTATPRANLWSYGTDSWAGWANGSDTLDADATALVEVRLGNGPGGFPLNGKMAGAVVYSSALSDADGETLEDAAQHWADLSPAAMWRLNQASTSTAVEDDTAGGADQTSLTGTTVDTGDDPDPFDFDLGGAAVTGTAAANLGALTAAATGTRKVSGAVTATLGTLVASALGDRAVYGAAAASLGGLNAASAGARTVYGTAAATATLTAAAAGMRTVYGAAATTAALTAAAVGAQPTTSATSTTAVTARRASTATATAATTSDPEVT
jgi:hypothetical protein